ncbi:5-oxoprolinase subunit C family protein [Agromyces mangrovi Wang et al. 2018]|uniref:5-oxoprolinase subunit C family protein n=1 Tax=Agromyces mangrovi TaxID=1858653 RepID=UPI002573A99A|nr:biotin-dependent carboxyltransferase family protein [Agromyces mangrovi]BDZ63908.1 allophanate hydrolase [Agromyces mangrovi]
MTGRLTVLAPGALTLVEDRGRPGWAHLGVGESGAADRAALGLANRLVGNAPHTAALECAIGGLHLRFDDAAWFAVTGAWGDVTLDGEAVRPETATRARPGAELVLPTAAHGLRYVVGVRGGIAVPRVLGSRSRDTLAGLGPAPLAAGDEVPIGDETAGAIPALDRLTAWAPVDDQVVAGLVPGPRADWFTDAARLALFETEWRVSPQSDRIGVRLDGPALERRVPGELASEGVVRGSVQVPPTGTPTVLLADHPVTGGYPVIAVVSHASIDAFAQLRPGQSVRFRHA